MQSHSLSRHSAHRGESHIRASELPPKAISDVVTMMVLPHESKTPRGAPPSRIMKRDIDQTRSGKSKIVERFLSFLWFRKGRGEDTAQVAASLEVAAALVMDTPADTPTLDLSKHEVVLDSHEDVKQLVFTVDPKCPRAAAEYLEAAGAEIAAKRPLMAAAMRVVAGARR